MKFLQTNLLLVVLLTMLVSGVSFSQVNKVTLSMGYPSTGDSSKISFGFDKTATACISLTGGEFDEAEAPPFPFEGYEVRFVNTNPPVGDDACYGQGSYADYRAWGASVVTDTFTIKMQAPPGPSANFSWSWPAGLSSVFSSLTLKDGIFGIFTFDMLATNTASTSSSVNKWYIIATPIAQSVRLDNNLMPGEFSLNQNYPNPFNPSTTVSFSIEKPVFADIAVYDVLGQKVRTLASEDLAPGYYSSVWNGVDDRGNTVGSGVYYVRMTARGDASSSQTVFSAVRKIVLMK